MRSHETNRSRVSDDNNISQLLRDSFSVSQQPPIWEPPTHYSMWRTQTRTSCQATQPHTCCSPLQCCSAARGHSFTEKMIYYFCANHDYWCGNVMGANYPAADSAAHVMSDHIRMSHTNHWPQPRADQPEYVARNIFKVGHRRRIDMQLIYVRCYYPYFTLPDTTARHRWCKYNTTLQSRCMS